MVGTAATGCGEGFVVMCIGLEIGVPPAVAAPPAAGVTGLDSGATAFDVGIAAPPLPRRNIRCCCGYPMPLPLADGVDAAIAAAAAAAGVIGVVGVGIVGGGGERFCGRKPWVLTGTMGARGAREG